MLVSMPPRYEKKACEGMSTVPMVDNGGREAVIAARVNKELSLLRYGQDESGQEVLIMASLDEEGEERQSLSSSSGRSIPQQQHQKPYRGVTKTVMMAWEKGYMEALVQALDIKKGEDEVLEIGFGLAYSATAIQERAPKRHVIIECDGTVLQKAREWVSTRQAVEIIEGYWQKELPHVGHFDCIFYDDFPSPVPGEDEATMLKGTGSRWHHFIDLCVSHHMRKGSRITGYMALDLDLGRADCIFERSAFLVQIPLTCPYATAGEQTYYIPLVTLQQTGSSGGHVLSGTRRGDILAAGGDEEEEENVVIHVDKTVGRKRAALLSFVLRDRETRQRGHNVMVYNDKSCK